MKYLLNKKTETVYFCLYLSLILGLFLNEDFAFGYIRDYLLHKKVSHIFDNGILNALLNYEKLDFGTVNGKVILADEISTPVPHSPLFIFYFFIIEKISNSEFVAKLIHLHFCLLIPYVFYKCIKEKYGFNNKYLKFVPAIIFISPYFRSGAIWIDDNIFALIFFVLSIYYFIKIEKSEKNILTNIFFNILFLAAASYFRPIYSIFAIFFLFNYLNKLNYFRLIYYIFLNLLLSLPAIYYVFVLEINQWFENYLFRTDFITLISLSISVIFFYFIPFIKIFLKFFLEYKFKKIDILVLCSIFLLIYINFDYHLLYSGGIVYKVSNLIFDNSFLIFFFSSISIFVFFRFFSKIKNRSNLNDILLIFLLIFMEIDGVIYHETYDPLIYLIFFLIFKNKYINDYIKKIGKFDFTVLSSFVSIFYLLSIFKTYL